MSSRAFLSASLATLLAGSLGALAFAGCGSSDAGPGPSATDASFEASGDDASALDANGNADGGGLPDGLAPPQGAQILAATGPFLVNGLTGDGFVIYTDVAAGKVYALSVSGGTPAMIASVDDADTVFVDGSVVFVMPTVDQTTQTGPLTVWTSTSGAHPIASTTFAFTGAVRVSKNGTHIVYLDGVDVNANVADVTIVASDGSNKTKLVAGASIASCFPRVGFAGAYAIAQFCDAPAPSDGGAGDAGGDASAHDSGAPAGKAAHLQSFAMATGSRVLDTDVLADDRLDLVTNDTTARVLARTVDGLVVFGADLGIAATVIDADGVAGLFTSDGASILYTTTAKALVRTPVVTPAPVTLQANAATVLELSPNESSVLTYRTLDPTSGNYDLYVSSASAPSTSTTLTGAAEANLFGDPFTADSSHVLYSTAIDPNTLIGTLYVDAIAGGAPAVLGANVWIDTALAGTKVVFDDNDTNQATGDLEIVDVATSAKPTLLVSQIDQDFYVTAAKDKIVYGWSLMSGPRAGIWVLDVP